MTLITGAVLCTTARGDCLDDAAAFHHVNARLVRAIATVESGLHPAVTSINTNGSADIGLMQINTSWLPMLSHYGVTRAALYDQCTNAYVGAWILAQNIARLGLTWDAIGAYNASSPAQRLIYARKVYRQLAVDVHDVTVAPSRRLPVPVTRSAVSGSAGAAMTSVATRLNRTPDSRHIVRANSGATLVAWEASE